MQRRVQERTVRRRAALLDAAVDLMTDAGFTAVTHRAVAARAGVPLAATTYHFATRDDLLQQAFALLVDRELAHLAAVLDRPLLRRRGEPPPARDPGQTARDPGQPVRADQSARDPGRTARADHSVHGDRGRGVPLERLEHLAELLSRAHAGERRRQLGLWELYLQAGRDPALQHVARAWTDGCDAIVAGLLDRAGLPSGPEQVRLMAAVLSGLWLEEIVEDRPEAAARARAVVARALQSLA